MPIGSVKLMPGIDVERTPTINQTGYSTSNLGRFKDTLFQKFGGWQKFYPFTVPGVPRALHAWQDLNDVDWLAVGTTSMFGVITSSTLRNVTPQSKTTNPTPNFSTVINTPTVTIIDPGISNVTTFDAVYFNTPVYLGGLVLSGLYPIVLIGGATQYNITAASNATATVNNAGAVPSFTTTLTSPTVTVTITAHGLAVGGTINFPIATTVGGIVISGTYTVATVPTANTFTIIGSTAATSATTVSMNAALAQLVYYITLGPPATGTGYGIGGYGVGGYGSGSTPTSQTGTPITSTDWTFDNWGEIIIGCTSGGGIYYWQPSGGFTTAVFVSGGPAFNGGIFISMPQQILVAWGSTTSDTIGTEQDPLLVRWSDQLNFLEWSVSNLTQAGSFRIPTGSRVVGGLQGPQQGLIWTDLDLWAMSYLGPPLVFGFNKIGSNCGLAGAHSMAQLGASVYWMGRNNFFQMTGSGVQVLPCSVWDVVFQDLDTANLDKCVAAANTPFNEVMFYFPSASGGTGQCDKYVKYNILEKVWDYGTLDRAAWIDSSVLGQPIGASPGAIIYQHETTNDADGSPINASFESGYFMLSEGGDMVFVDWMIPDFKWGKYGAAQTTQIQITLKAVDYPNDTPRVYGPFTVSSTSQYFNPRVRGRQMSVKVESNDVGSFWRLGNVRYRFARDGKR